VEDEIIIHARKMTGWGDEIIIRATNNNGGAERWDYNPSQKQRWGWRDGIII